MQPVSVDKIAYYPRDRKPNIMNLKNTATQYGTITKFFHWAIVLLFLIQFVVAATMIWARNVPSVPDASKFEMITWHKSMGLLVLMLAIARFAWRQVNRYPSWPAGMKEWEKATFSFIERGLYLVLFVMPTSGLLVSVASGHEVAFFSLFQIPGFAKPDMFLTAVGWFLHRAASYAIIGLVTLHVGTVLRRHIFEKDGYLKRMLP